MAGLNSCILLAYYLLQVSNMKKNKGKYPEVSKLPNNALTVSEYAKQQGFTTNYVYNQIRDKKNTAFNIVVFQSFNFVIPT
jgi:hypothetical protein